MKPVNTCIYWNVQGICIFTDQISKYACLLFYFGPVNMCTYWNHYERL